MLRDQRLEFRLCFVSPASVCLLSLSLARYKGVLSGDSIIVDHTEGSRILGTFYVLAFLSVVVLMLLVRSNYIARALLPPVAFVRKFAAVPTFNLLMYGWNWLFLFVELDYCHVVVRLRRSCGTIR